MSVGRPRRYNADNANAARCKAYRLRKKAQSLDLDEEFWFTQGQLLGDLLRWFTNARSLSGIGARCCSLALYLNPEIIDKRALRDIAQMPDAPTRAALSKSMLEFQAKYGLKPSYYQKPEWMRERFSRSARVAHEQRNESAPGKESI